MRSENMKKLNKIYKRIDNIASKGKDNIIEYYKLVDEFIEKGYYEDFLQCLYYYYNIETKIYTTSYDVKHKTWNSILFNTNTSLSKKINKLYKSENVYQIGYDIFDVNTNVSIGKIEEKDMYDQDVKYYIQNKEFSKLKKTRTYYLKLNKNNYDYYVLSNEWQMIQLFNIPGTYSISNDVCTWYEPNSSIIYERGVTFSNCSYNTSVDQDLYTKYIISIKYLK